MLKREKDAFAAFEAAVAISSNAPPAAISMAMLHQQQGDAAKGEKWIQYALERNPKNFSTQLGAAQWNWQSGRLDAAAKHAAEALALNSESLDAQLLAAQAAYYQHQPDVAGPLLEKLHQRAPGNFVVTNLLAWSLAASDDVAQRKRAVELAGLNSERFPDSAEAAATLGWALHRVSNSKEAASSLQRIKANASLSRDAAYYVARVLHAAGETAQAEDLLKSALNNAGLFAAEGEARAWQATLESAPTDGS
jgi:tetratricopeptide (TPR) repeat protein